MRDIALISFAQTPFTASAENRDEVEMVRASVNAALNDAGLSRSEIGFTCSGSCDYVQGLPFSFVGAVDALGAWPPIAESHLEMDGAWALYEAFVRLQHGDIDTALVYCFGKPSLGDMQAVFSQQLDPYTMGPLWPDPDALAGLQARTLVDSGRASEADFAEVAARNLNAALANPHAHGGRAVDASMLLDAPYHRAPLRASDCAAPSDGAAAVVLAAGERARELARRAGSRPAWIRGIDHRVESMQLGLRDLQTSASTSLCAGSLNTAGQQLDVAELHTPYSPQELIVKAALGLGNSTEINPSGGTMGANAPMVAGLVRIGEVASRLFDGRAERGLAHATSGPCLQQNLVCIMEGE